MAKPVFILGLSFYYHDSAAVLLRDGEIVFAAQEERYTRQKHDDVLPVRAVAAALAHEGITIDDIAAVGFYEKPLLKFFDRIIPTFFKVWPRGFLQYQAAMQEWMTKKLWIPENIRKDLKYKGSVSFVPHHEAHAFSSFAVSGFGDATIVTVDGVGEWATATIGKGEGTDVRILKEIRYPHSLGLLYSAITYYLGFRVNSAEYKVMGLAPYGKPAYVEQMKKLITVKDDGGFRLDMRYFTYEHGLTMTGRRLEKLFGEPRREPEGPLTQFHKDVAMSLQIITEEVMQKIVAHAKTLAPSENLCLAGGVALNCVANGKILRSGLFRNIFIQPAAGDAGGALGVALAIWHRQFGGAKTRPMTHVFLGDAFGDDEIERFLKAETLPYLRLSDEDLIERVSGLLAGENETPRTVEPRSGDTGSRVIGWFQGRMEFGPRALGNRSIIADARNRENWRKVNLKIKFRESFRPFAPTVLEERITDYFDLDRETPYMLLVAQVRENRRAEIPAVTHVDGSARIQSIARAQNPRYYDLIKAFETRTGCGVIINTSFNVRGEPIVRSPADALRCFLNTHMDYLVLGNFVLDKKEMPAERTLQRKEYLEQFALD